jgi:two-component system chemotaxis response regulator CheB
MHAPQEITPMKKSTPTAKQRLAKKKVCRVVKPTRAATAKRFPVVAMAASVGGLDALSVILGGLPADFPGAIAIVMHLSPTHESILAEILDRRTPLPVQQARTGDVLGPGRVFVAPPNHHLFVAGDGRLKLSSSHAEKINYARPSAEPLFASVAAVYRKTAIAVVLTGGDGDGAFGVQVIKDHGGNVIAQDRPTSKDFSMPQTSIETGDVDFILPLGEIAAKLLALVATKKMPTARRVPVRGKLKLPAFAKIVRPAKATATKTAVRPRRK